MTRCFFAILFSFYATSALSTEKSVDFLTCSHGCGYHVLSKTSQEVYADKDRTFALTKIHYWSGGEIPATPSWVELTKMTVERDYFFPTHSYENDDGTFKITVFYSESFEPMSVLIVTPESKESVSCVY